MSDPGLQCTLISHAVQLLKKGHLVAFPTETVYGLGADATNTDAIRQVFAAKGRPSTNPLIVHVAEIEQARRYATHWPESAEKLARAFWPGPLTLVLPKHHSIVDLATAGQPTVGLRAPDHPLALELLRQFDGPLAGPSANRSNHISPTTAEHVRQELGDAVQLILDGGPCRVGIESTVLNLAGATPTVLRPGGISQAKIESIIGPVTCAGGHVPADVAASSPGQQRVHYSPQTPAFWLDGHQWQTHQSELLKDHRHGILRLASLEAPSWIGACVAMPSQPDSFAHHLYGVLHILDALNLTAIYIQLPPDEPAWIAVRDRLQRAARPLPRPL